MPFAIDLMERGEAPFVRVGPSEPVTIEQEKSFITGFGDKARTRRANPVEVIT